MPSRPPKPKTQRSETRRLELLWTACGLFVGMLLGFIAELAWLGINMWWSILGATAGAAIGFGVDVVRAKRRKHAPVTPGGKQRVARFHKPEPAGTRSSTSPRRIWRGDGR